MMPNPQNYFITFHGLLASTPFFFVSTRRLDGTVRTRTYRPHTQLGSTFYQLLFGNHCFISALQAVVFSAFFTSWETSAGFSAGLPFRSIDTWISRPGFSFFFAISLFWHLRRCRKLRDYIPPD